MKYLVLFLALNGELIFDLPRSDQFLDQYDYGLPVNDWLLPTSDFEEEIELPEGFLETLPDETQEVRVKIIYSF